MDEIERYMLAAALASVALAVGVSSLGVWARWRTERRSGGAASRAGAVPSVVVAAPIAAYVWGAFTLLVLVPGGVLFVASTFLFDLFFDPRTPGSLDAWKVAAVVAAISGVVHAFLLIFVGLALQRRRPGVTKLARKVGISGRCHQVLVAIAIPLLAMRDPLWGTVGGLWLAAWLSGPCALGLMIFDRVAAAGRAIHALELANAARDHVTTSTASPTASSTTS